MVGRRIALFFAVLVASVLAHAQALPTATGVGISFQGGIGVSFANSDYGTEYLKGASAFGNVDLSSGLGLVLEYNDDNVITPQDFGETTFLGGIRYSVKKRSFHPYVKALAGVGTIHFSKGLYASNSSYSYTTLGLGAGLDYRVSEHFFVRAIDFEYQDWRNFPPNNLTPYVITIGAGYHWP